MGVLAELGKVFSTSFASLRGTPGKQVNAKATGLGDAGMEGEVAQSPGILGRPPKDSRGVFIRLTKRYGIFVGFINYKLNFPALQQGETLLHSTDADGATLKATVYLDQNGVVVINSGTASGVKFEQLESSLASFLTALNTSLATAGGTPVTLNISTAKATNTKLQ